MKWIDLIEIGTFVVLFVSFIYSRMANWKKFNDRTSKLEISFDQYQKDQSTSQDRYEKMQADALEAMRELFATYLKTCEECRRGVQHHHESDERHVTPDLRSQISTMSKNIDAIMQHLMRGQA